MGRKSRAKKERKNLDPEVRRAQAAEAQAAKSAPSGKPLPVTDATFDSTVAGSDVPVLVDFWAPWCGPCKTIAPVLEQLAAEMKGELKIVKYNTQENQRVAGEMNIRSIPTLVLFRDGEVVDVQIGMVPPDRLKKWLEKRLAPKRSLIGRLLGRDEAAA